MFLKSSENVGKLEVVCGSMFSGKSEELILSKVLLYLNTL